MPVHKVKSGYKWGESGKTYPTKEQAEKQAAAIYASGWREEADPIDPPRDPLLPLPKK